MKRLAAVVFAGLVFASPALADDIQFSLINNSEYVVDQFYASVAGGDSWGDDILGQDTLPGGGTATITLTGAGEECLFDLKVVDEEDAEHEIEGVDLCENSEVTFTK